MADLLDIAPSTAVDVVKVGDKRVIVHGLHVDAIASIVARVPQLRSIAAGGGDLVTRLITMAGAAVGPIIAAGCGHPNDETYEKHAVTLSIEEQAKFLKAILWLTFPNGIGPFLELMTSLMGGAVKPKPVKMRLKTLPSTLPQSSGSDLRLTVQ
jgi:hypothetical protein